jgi:hypothetical protein
MLEFKWQALSAIDADFALVTRQFGAWALEPGVARRPVFL